MSDLDRAVAAVTSSKKYRAVCADTVRRIAVRELAKRKNLKSAVKATKRRLHQVYGAFEPDLDYGALYRGLETAYGTGSESDLKTACRDVLGLHISTRERLAILDGFYPAIFEVTGQPHSILDLGCGLNPLSLPWMDPGGCLRYTPLDIDEARIRFLNRVLSLAGRESLARCQDILVHPPKDVADVALLLKMSPSLERQEPGSTGRLIEQLKAPIVVVSFAIQSLGGRDKHMRENYERHFLDHFENRGWPFERLLFETELVFVLEKPPLTGGGTSPLAHR